MSMTPDLLVELGLNRSQALTYMKLITQGELSPPELSKLTGESRTNTYNVLSQLTDMGLTVKTKGKSVKYRASNPMALEKISEDRRRQLSEVEQRVKASMPAMLTYFYSFTETPGVRLLQGVDGVREVYEDILRTKKDVYFLRSPKDVDIMGEEYYEEYKKRRADLGITTYALTQDTETSREHAKLDEVHKMVRTWVDIEDYTAPVEIDVYGEKTAFFVYGEEVMAVILHSPAIAESLRQLLGSMKKVAHSKSAKKVS